MNWLKENWFKIAILLIAIIAIGAYIWGTFIHLPDAQENAQNAALVKQEASKQMESDNLQNCLNQANQTLALTANIECKEMGKTNGCQLSSGAEAGLLDANEQTRKECFEEYPQN